MPSTVSNNAIASQRCVVDNPSTPARCCQYSQPPSSAGKVRPTFLIYLFFSAIHVFLQERCRLFHYCSRHLKEDEHHRPPIAAGVIVDLRQGPPAPQQAVPSPLLGAPLAPPFYLIFDARQLPFFNNYCDVVISTIVVHMVGKETHGVTSMPPKDLGAGSPC